MQFYVVNACDRVRIPALSEQMIHCRHTAVSQVRTKFARLKEAIVFYMFLPPGLTIGFLPWKCKIP